MPVLSRSVFCGSGFDPKGYSPFRKLARASRFGEIAALTLVLAALGVAHAGADDAVFSRTETDARGNRVSQVGGEGMRLVIRLGKQTYAPEEPVLAEFKVINRGQRTLRFYPAVDFQDNFRLHLRTRQNRSVAPGAAARRERFSAAINAYGGVIQGPYSPAPVLAREVALEPGESFSRQADLSRLFDLRPGEGYMLAGYFIPEPAGHPDVFARNTGLVAFEIGEPKLTAPNPTMVDRGAISSALNGAPLVSPAETVFLLLTAEYRRKGGDILKFIDLEKYIRAFEGYSREWADADINERAKVLADFGAFLASGRQMPLKRFAVVSERETVPGRVAEVVCDVERQNPSVTRRYQYTYLLEKNLDINGWRVTYLTVRARK